MPNWKKVLLSGSKAAVYDITASNLPAASDTSLDVVVLNSEGHLQIEQRHLITSASGPTGAVQYAYYDGTSFHPSGSSNFIFEEDTTTNPGLITSSLTLSGSGEAIFNLGRDGGILKDDVLGVINFVGTGSNHMEGPSAVIRSKANNDFGSTRRNGRLEFLVPIGPADPTDYESPQLTISESIVSSSVNVLVPNLHATNDITASNHISASNNIYASAYYVANTASIYSSNDILQIAVHPNWQTLELGRAGGSTIVKSHLTASKNISASGHINAFSYLLENTESLSLLTDTLALGKNSDIEGVIISRPAGYTSITSHLTASKTISASGHLFASTSNASGQPYLTVLVDTGSGKFFYTGSYGGGGGGSSISFNGSTTNGVLTYNSATTIDVESTLQYDGNNGDLILPTVIRHYGNTANDYFGFPNNNEWVVRTSGQDAINVNNSSIVINDGGVSRDFRVETITSNDNFFIDASSGKIGTNTNSPDHALTVKSLSVGVSSISLVNADSSAYMHRYITKTYAGIAVPPAKPLYIGESNYALTDQLDSIGFTFLSGELGMGTTSPTAPLDIIKTENGSIAKIYNQQGKQNVSGIKIKLNPYNASEGGYLTGQTLQTQHFIQFWNNLQNGSEAQIGKIRRGELAQIVYDTTSDKRLKTNIKNLNAGLDTLLKIKPRTFNWKGQEDNSAKTDGFIAQELYKIYPGVVYKPTPKKPVNEDPWSINYQGLIPLLVQSIKDQQAIIKKLETRIKKLENNVN